MSTDTITVDIPAQLDRRITPNGRAHWRTKYRLTQDLKDTTALACRAAGLLDRAPARPPVRVSYWIGLAKGRKRLDEDNCVAALKPVQDAIAQAIGVDDRHFTVGTVAQHRDPDGLGFIRVCIESEAA